jgi:hypothetical protein
VAGFLELVWLPAKQASVDRSTFDQYAWAVRRHIVPGLGQFKLVELEPKVLDRWLRRLGSAGRGDGRPLSVTSVRLVRKVLAMACADAVDRGFVAENPVRHSEAPRAAPSGVVGWTADEVRRFLAASDGHREWNSRRQRRYQCLRHRRARRPVRRRFSSPWVRSSTEL